MSPAHGCQIFHATHPAQSALAAHTVINVDILWYPAIPALAPTQCYELTTQLRAPDGTSVVRTLHGTIHKLSEK